MRKKQDEWLPPFPDDVTVSVQPFTLTTPSASVRMKNSENVPAAAGVPVSVPVEL